MTTLRLESGLLFVALQLCFGGHETLVQGTLLDTGAASTVITAPIADLLEIGGAEWVYTKQLDYLQIGTQRVPAFEIEVSGSDYGFGIEAILGTDFLLAIGAVIDLKTLILTAS